MMLNNTDFSENAGITSFGGHAGAFLEVRLKSISWQADLLYNYDQFEGVLNTFDTKLILVELRCRLCSNCILPGPGLTFRWEDKWAIW